MSGGEPSSIKRNTHVTRGSRFRNWKRRMNFARNRAVFMYQALYRKYRPAVFSDVVGQDHITRTLQKQVAENRTSHAYLFTGSRGTGKTTCAKILARAVNCEHPNNGNPCGECPACIALENGTSLDVLELDAASNNGVDQVRALRDEAVYPPANVRKRVYIVDEVHMLSTSAFNALLKILEEPPEHLMFILATTELHKVPATILSRCQRYAFRRIQPRDIASRLLYVAGRERIPLTGDGAELLARLAEGALRDGLSLLDQCAASGATVDAASILDTLGLAGHLRTAQLLEHILRRDVPSALALFGELYDSGRDGRTVLNELSALVRDLLLRRMAPDGSAALLSGGYAADTLDRLETLADANRFLYMASTLQGAGAALYDAANSRLNAELYLLRLCDETLSGNLDALLSRVERLESAWASGMPNAATVPNSAAPPQSAPITPAVRQSAPVAPTVPQSAPVAAAITEAPPIAPDTFSDRDAPPLDDTPSYDAPPWENAPQDLAPPSADNETPSSDGATAKMIQFKVPVVSAAAPPLNGTPSHDAPPWENASQDLAPPSMDWNALAERCRNRLPPMYGAFLGQCVGVLADGVLTIYGDSVTLSRLNNDRVTTAFLEESGAKRVAMREGSPPPVADSRRSPQENQADLVNFSRRHADIIHVVGGDKSTT